MQGGEGKAGLVAAGQQLALAVRAVTPDWTDCVNDPARRQTEAWCDPRLSGWAAAKPTPRLGKLGTSPPVNRPVDATPTLQCGVRRVDDRVDQLGCDIARQ